MMTLPPSSSDTCDTERHGVPLAPCRRRPRRPAAGRARRRRASYSPCAVLQPPWHSHHQVAGGEPSQELSYDSRRSAPCQPRRTRVVRRLPSCEPFTPQRQVRTTTVQCRGGVCLRACVCVCARTVGVRVGWGGVGVGEGRLTTIRRSGVGLLRSVLRTALASRQCHDASSASTTARRTLAAEPTRPGSNESRATVSTALSTPSSQSFRTGSSLPA